MKRYVVLSLLLAGAVWPQQDKRAQKSKPAPQVQEQVPPEEDESVATKQYSFNPLEAEKDLKVGNYYFKKGDYKAAMSRFREATLWNPTYAEAFLRLGESEDKLKDKPAAGQAYNKFLELAPTGKEADAVKKRLARDR
ncbi:MAG TPA: tetratricopeptide repeat protein [Bryobacteraceae bacterium]|nr:tetratricopeptide repeat protein [Bryobacteraceae bacterium]